MSYHIPDGWRLPVRGPQHAAPFGRSTPRHRNTRRALRLFAAAGAWGAGLCLVIGLVTLVAEAAGPRRAAQVRADARGYATRPGRAGLAARHLPGTRRHPAGRPTESPVTRTFSGTGDRTTAGFRTASHSQWELRWSYQCPAREPGGGLVIRAGGAPAASASVAATGATGRGSTWTYSDGPVHYLVVLTSCHWSVTVAGRR